MQRRTTRRRFLAGVATVAGGFAASAARGVLGSDAPGTTGPTADLAPRAYSPVLFNSRQPERSRTVQMHGTGATYWDFSTPWYGQFVDSAVVEQMMAQGLQRLMKVTSAAAAWGLLLPGYAHGQKIAVKINLNNASCTDADNAIDALPQVVNALIGSLAGAGIDPADVWVYDARRPMPARYLALADRRAHYVNTSCGDAGSTFNCSDPSLRVTFRHPDMQNERWLCDLLHQATYLINMPILKRHSTAPVTLGFKNHFGSLSDLGGPESDNPHTYINVHHNLYRTDANPLVDINANPNIAGKTVLTIGDALFGARMVGATPEPWHKTFGGSAPNTLLFSRDPVAIDSVMVALLDAEWGVDPAAYDYLRAAAERGLGTFEEGAPWGVGYQKIDYARYEVT
jgi:uncharacterized protein (DUF362 family)